MTQIKEYHWFKLFKNKEQTFEITVKSIYRYFSCTRSKMAETNCTRKDHWEIARKWGVGREAKLNLQSYIVHHRTPPKQIFMNFTTDTILFAYSAKQEQIFN